MKKIFSMLALLLMTAVGATAQTTYTVTVKDGTEDAAKWSAAPNPAREGQGVTIKYNGTKKVKSIKAVKKEPAKAAAAATAEDQGKVIAANGKIYDTRDSATVAGTTAVAKIIYVGSSTDNSTYTHGLALALADESGMMVWSTAISTCSAKNTSLAVTDASWMLPSRAQWNTMISAAGSHKALRDGFNSVGGTNMKGATTGRLRSAIPPKRGTTASTTTAIGSTTISPGTTTFAPASLFNLFTHLPVYLS